MARQAAFETPVNPTIGFPITALTGAPVITATIDQGHRGIGARDFEALPDAGHSEFNIEAFVYPAEIGHFLLAMFGAVSTAAGPPIVHTFSRGDSPSSYTIEDVVKAGASGALRYTGSRIGSLAFSYEAAQGVLGFTSAWMSQIGTVVTPQAVTVSPADSPFQGWLAQVTSTDFTAKVTQAELTISRELQVVHVGEDSQQPLHINAGPIAIEGTLTLVVDNLDFVDKYRTGVKQALSIVFDQGQAAAAQRKIEFTLANAFFAASPVEIDRGGVSVFARMGFSGIYNATDLGPGRAILTNATASAVYTA